MEVKVVSEGEKSVIFSPTLEKPVDALGQAVDRPSVGGLSIHRQGSPLSDATLSTRRTSRILPTVVTLAVCAAVVGAIIGASIMLGSLSAGVRSEHRRSATNEVALIRLSADKARETGAYCLDGTVPAYYFKGGSSGGQNKWRIVLEGGGYCESLARCYTHTFTEFGTSRVLRSAPTGLGGFLSSNPDSNPEFYNWNAVFVHYCDGSSFSGNRTDPVTYRGRTLYFRGSRILDAILDDLLENRGLQSAEQVVLAGNSAGGIAVFRHADHMRSRLPSHVQFAALPGSALFVWDVRRVQRTIKRLAFLHGMLDGPNFPACARAFSPNERWKCLLPQFAATYVQSAMFVLNSAYDSWALKNILRLRCVTLSCLSVGRRWSTLQVYKYRVWAVIFSLSSRQGAYIPSCTDHFLLQNESWNGLRVHGRTPMEAFADWLYGRSFRSKTIDGSPNFNPTCS